MRVAVASPVYLPLNESPGGVASSKFFFHSLALKSWLASLGYAAEDFSKKGESFDYVLALEYDTGGAGFARTANASIKKALESGAELILLANDDLLLGDNLVLRAVEFFNYAVTSSIAASSDGFVFSFPVYFGGGCSGKDCQERLLLNTCGDAIDESSGYTYSRRDCGFPEGSSFVEVEALSGVLMIAHRKLWEKFFPPFDESLGSYFEDTLFSIRLRRSGVKLFVVDGAAGYHYVSASFGLYSPKKTFYLAKNSWRVLFEANLRFKKGGPVFSKGFAGKSFAGAFVDFVKTFVEVFKVSLKRTRIFGKYASMGFGSSWLKGDFKGLAEVLRRIFSSQG